MSYAEFIKSKVRSPQSFGFTPGELNSNLFDWQAKIVEWALKRGRAAMFEECGLGKTLQQLEWAAQIVRHTGGKVAVHCPVGVRMQTLEEAAKFGISVDVRIVDSNNDVKAGISLINYEKLHKVDTGKFVGVVLDESSILKNFTGTTKRMLIEQWKHARFRLACTATPAPNDHMELGNHADFLGVMPSNEMLSRWFINDTMQAGGYRLKGHGASDFWKWVATWACCIAKPSDIGGSDEGFDLPPLHEITHVVPEPFGSAPGMLFNNYEISATNVHKQKRLTVEARSAKVAELVDAGEPFLIWCDTDYEADALKRALPEAEEVRGSDKRKQEKLLGFAKGEFLHLITKPSIAGFGMNYQHCSKMAFVGLSFSFEEYYQAVRRCWRFGQANPVFAHAVESEGESALREVVTKKQEKFKQMRESMSDAVLDFQLADELNRETYKPTKQMEVPAWIS